MEFLGNINSIYSLIAFVLFYGVTELVKWQKKKKISESKSAERCKEIHRRIDTLSDQLTAHVESDKERAISIQGIQVLQLIQTTPANCNVLKFERLKRSFNKYDAIGGNGVVADAFAEWLEKRENSVKNLKQNQVK